MKIDGKIYQIRPNNSSKVYINILETDDAFGLCAWLNSAFNPTYLMRARKSEYIYFLIQFHSQEIADEWLREHERNYEIVLNLSEEEATDADKS